MMELAGKLWKSGKFWLVEVPAVEVMTQGHKREEALIMIGDAIEGLMKCYFPDKAKGFTITVHEYEKGVIGVSTSNNSLMLAFSLKRQALATIRCICLLSINSCIVIFKRCIILPNEVKYG